ncbi:unnamed protein product [Meloidogyne enterolobii]|uniref:Uncharacterized protein n=1 Tax=Meloidogyne enterolobii TaxID=390850 RepID=A0ACB0ZGD2_MELEN
MENVDINVVDKKLFEGKILSSQAKIGDISKVYEDLILLEDGVNRNLRATNRNITHLENNLKGIEDGANAGFEEVAKRIDIVGEDVNKLDEKVESIRTEFQDRDNLEFDELRSSGAANLLRANSRPAVIPPPPPPKHNSQSASTSNSNTITTSSLGKKANNNLNENKNNQNNGQELNVLNEIGTSGPQLNVFTGEVASAFDEWAIRFRDYVEVFGSTWTEMEKLNRLKLYLGAQARQIFENLLVTERNTLANALMNIRAKLDSPHFRELAYKRLAACYQREGESVSEFIKRLVPLVNTTSSHAPNDT